MRYSPSYYNASQMQTQLLQRVHDGKTSARDLAQLVRTWIDLEKFKREIRGIPPLAPASLKEIKEFAENLKRTRRALVEPVEVA